MHLSRPVVAPPWFSPGPLHLAPARLNIAEQPSGAPSGFPVPRERRLQTRAVQALPASQLCVIHPCPCSVCSEHAGLLLPQTYHFPLSPHGPLLCWMHASPILQPANTSTSLNVSQAIIYRIHTHNIPYHTYTHAIHQRGSGPVPGGRVSPHLSDSASSLTERKDLRR